MSYEIGLRKTLFDYLDGVSNVYHARKDYNYGDRHNKDWYHSIGISISYIIFTTKCPFPIKPPPKEY